MTTPWSIFIKHLAELFTIYKKRVNKTPLKVKPKSHIIKIKDKTWFIAMEILLLVRGFFGWQSKVNLWKFKPEVKNIFPM